MPKAERDLRELDRWWLQSHGFAPSRLEVELVEARVALAEHPYLGYEHPWQRGQARRLALASGFFVIYRVRPRLREVLVLRILHATRLYSSLTR